MPTAIWIKGEYRVFEELEEALKKVKEDGGIVLLFEGEPFIIRIERFKEVVEEDGHTRRLSKSPHLLDTVSELELSEPLAIVFDQMFRGFADVIVRELPEYVEVHEILGKGIEAPIRVGRITRWPAHDDYDVLKTVEKLGESGRQVILITGDKRLARQVAALGNPRIKVEYMPPNEYPGKESIIRRIVALVKE